MDDVRLLESALEKLREIDLVVFLFFLSPMLMAALAWLLLFRRPPSEGEGRFRGLRSIIMMFSIFLLISTAFRGCWASFSVPAHFTKVQILRMSIYNLTVLDLLTLMFLLVLAICLIILGIFHFVTARKRIALHEGKNLQAAPDGPSEMGKSLSSSNNEGEET